MALRPLHDRILVQRTEEEEQKVGGIIIPDSAKEKPQQGKVTAVGAGKAAAQVKIGCAGQRCGASAGGGASMAECALAGQRERAASAKA